MGSVLEEVIPIDGKSLRGSYDREKGLKNLHLVTAWAREQRLVLGQVKVEDHSNEITAIPALLELIDIAGAIVTLDAMGTQTELVGLIHKKKADYVVALKSNHPTLYHQVKDWFETAKTQEFKGIEMSYGSRTEKGHYRLETQKQRRYQLPKSEDVTSKSNGQACALLLSSKEFVICGTQLRMRYSFT